MITVGELFAGYGGMHLGLNLAVGETRIIWYAENAPGPAAVMRRHHPFVPNLGDVTRRDWSTIPRPDILTGGTPCQDVSHSGTRRGMRPGTRSGLWATMCDAIEGLRPPVVLWENVRGVVSADADSGLEWCPGCMGDESTEPHLRALGRVLGDLADLGYNAFWTGLPASAVGAAHGRYRIFLVATTPDARRLGPQIPVRREHPTIEIPRREGDSGRARPRQRRGPLLPTPVSKLGSAGPDLVHAVTPGATGDDLVTAIDLLEVPAGRVPQWAEYANAITRWETVIGRPAPPPTEVGPKGGRALSPRFVEWLMGLDDGHVTQTPGLTPRVQLETLGNGVVPQQLAAALTHYLDQVER